MGLVPMHKSGPDTSHKERGECHREKLQDLLPHHGTTAITPGKTDSKRDKLGSSGGRLDGCGTRSVRYVSGGVVRQVELKVAVLRICRLEHVLERKLRRGMAVSETPAGVTEAKLPSTQAPAGSKSDAKPIAVRMSAPVPCKAGPACKRLLRKTTEKGGVQAVLKGAKVEDYDDVSDVPLDEYCDDSSSNARSRLSSSGDGARLPPHKKRCRVMCLEDYDRVSDTPLEEYDDDTEKHAHHSAPSKKVTHGKATAKAPRPISQPKVKGNTGQRKHPSRGHLTSINKDEKKLLEASESSQPEAASTAPAKHTSNTTAELQSNGTETFVATSTKPNDKSSLAFAAGKDVVEKKALKRPGLPCRNEGAKKLKADFGAEISKADSFVGTVKKNSRQSSTMKVPPNKSVKNSASHAKNSPEKHAGSCDNHSVTKETAAPKSNANAIAAKVGTGNDGIHRAREDASSSLVKRALRNKLVKKPESATKGSSGMSASNLGISAKHLPVTMQKTTNDKAQKSAGCACHHNASLSAARNSLPNRLAQKPELHAKSSFASNQSGTTQAVPSTPNTNDRAQTKVGCCLDTTQQNIRSSVTKKVLPKTTKKSMSSDMPAKGNTNTSKKGALAESPISTPRGVTNAAEAKVGCSSGTHVQTASPLISKRTPSPSIMVKKLLSCSKSLDISARKSCHLTVPTKSVTSTSEADRGLAPSIPAKKPMPNMNSHTSKVFTLEKVARVDKESNSDPNTNHKKYRGGHSGAPTKERVAGNAASHSNEQREGSKPSKVSATEQFKSPAPSTSGTSVEVKISRSKLTRHDMLVPCADLASSVEFQELKQNNQQLSKLPGRMPSSEQGNNSVSFPESDSSLLKARDVNLPDEHEASNVHVTTSYAEATVSASSEGTWTMEKPIEITTCLERKAHASKQPARNAVDTVSDTAHSGSGCHKLYKTGTSQNTCTSKVQGPGTDEVWEVMAAIITQVTKDLTDLADIGAEVDCDYDCVSKTVTIHQDQVKLPQDAGSMAGGLGAGAESAGDQPNSRKLAMDGAEHAPLEQNVENTSEVVEKDAMALSRKTNYTESEQPVTSTSVCMSALTQEQRNALSPEELCSISPSNKLGSDMSAANADCDKPSDMLPKSCCLQKSTGKEEPAANDRFNAAMESDSSAPTLHEHSHQQSRALLLQKLGSEATTVMKEIHNSEPVAVCKKVGVEKATVPLVLVASEAAVEVMGNSDITMCATNESNCQQEPAISNSTPQEKDTGNRAVAISQISFADEAPGEKDNGKKAGTAGESSEQRAKDLCKAVPRDMERSDLAQAMNTDNYVRNERSAHKQVDDPKSIPEALQQSSGTLPRSSGVCDEGSSAETSDTFSLLSEDIVKDASKPGAIIAGAVKSLRHSKKRKRNSTGTNTSLCSAWLFSRNRRRKPHRDRHRKSTDENSSSSTLASMLPEAATANTSTATGVLTEDIHTREAAPQIKKEPPEVSTCGNTLISTSAEQLPYAASTVHPGSAKDAKSVLYKKPVTPLPTSSHAMVSSSVHGALLDLDMFTGLSILDVCGSTSTVDLKDLKVRILRHTITKNDAVAEIARAVRSTVVEEYFKGQRAAKTLQLLSKIPFSLEPTNVHKIRKLTQAVVEKSELCTNLYL